MNKLSIAKKILLFINVPRFIPHLIIGRMTAWGVSSDVKIHLTHHEYLFTGR